MNLEYVGAMGTMAEQTRKQTTKILSEKEVTVLHRLFGSLRNDEETSLNIINTNECYSEHVSHC